MLKESTPPSQPNALPPRLDLLPPGQPIPFTLKLGDWEIPGEVLLADAWQPELGLIKSEKVRFRLVFLTCSQEVPPPSLASPRVAVCVPGGGAPALRERRQVYQTGPSPTSTPPPGPDAYAAGQVVTQKGRLAAAELFTTPELAGWCQSLGSTLFSPTSDAILPYAQMVAPQISPAAIETASTTHLESLTSRLAPLPAALERLTSALGPVSHYQFHQAFQRLSRLAQQPNYQGFYLAAESLYGQPQRLEADLSLIQRLETLTPHIPQIAAAKIYLEGAIIGERDQELSMDRRSLLEQLTSDYLLASPHLWPSLDTLFQWFKSRYSAAYQSHFRRWQQQIVDLRHLLQEKGAEVQALRHLNSIGELGKPQGQELVDTYTALLDRLNPCPLGVDRDQPVDSVPVCPHCSLRLTDEAPGAEVNAFVQGLEEALREQMRRLSSRAIHLILNQSREPRLKRFLQIAQVSDLSSLPGVLDDELATFIGQLLKRDRESRQRG